MRLITQTSLPFLFLLSLFSSCSSVSLDPTKFSGQAADANRDETRIEKALNLLCDKSGPDFCEKEARILLENGKPELAKVAAARGCQKERNSACALAGDILLAEGKIPEAAQVLTSACESKSALDGIACPGAGEAAFLSRDQGKALRLWKRGCTLGNLVSCYYEGKAHRLANRVSESLAPLKRACDGQILGACSELGISHALGGKIPLAAEKFTQDCDRRSQRACRWLPLLVEKTKNSGLEKTLDQDCRKNNSLEACYDSVVLQFLRQGGRTLALYRWKQNCKAGHKMSCWENFLEENGLRPLSQMNPELEKFCEEGILAACYSRGLNYAEQGNRDKAVPIWKDACSKGEAWSCAMASESDTLLEAERAKLREQACILGLKNMCIAIDSSLVEVTVKKAASAPIDFAAACNSGDADACTYLGTQKATTSEQGFQDGEAKEKFRRACLASSTLGCEGLVKGLN